jgi:hypothetical protein
MAAVGQLEAVTLRLRLTESTELDQLRFFLNGASPPPPPSESSNPRPTRMPKVV